MLFLRLCYLLSVDECFSKVCSNEVWCYCFINLQTYKRKIICGANALSWLSWLIRCIIADIYFLNSIFSHLEDHRASGVMILWTFTISICHEFHDGMAARENVSLFQIIYYSEYVIVKIHSITLTGKAIFCLSILLQQYNKIIRRIQQSNQTQKISRSYVQFIFWYKLSDFSLS